MQTGFPFPIGSIISQRCDTPSMPPSSTEMIIFNCDANEMPLQKRHLLTRNFLPPPFYHSPRRNRRSLQVLSNSVCLRSLALAQESAHRFARRPNLGLVGRRDQKPTGHMPSFSASAFGNTRVQRKRPEWARNAAVRDLCVDLALGRTMLAIPQFSGAACRGESVPVPGPRPALNLLRRPF